MQKINVITLCSGYDSQCLALKRLKENYSDFDFNLVAWAEFDPESKQPIKKQPAVIAHNALFPEYKGRNMGDMTKCDWSSIKEHIDLLFYSTPCQSISSAGLQHGLKEGSGTRSSIIWNVLDAIDTLKPKYLVLENVKALVSNKFIKDFNDWQNQLEKRGYTNYWNILNAKDFGVPQNRERVFLVSILGENERFYFPEPFKLEKRLKDVLEKNVDEKYYLSQKTIEGFSKHNEHHEAKGTGFVWKPKTGDDVANCLRANAALCPTDNTVEIPHYGNKRVQSVVDKGLIDPDKVQFIDAYNQSVLDDVSNTIKTAVDTSCMSFVTEPKIVQQFGDRGTKQYSVRDIAHTIPANPMSDRGQMLLEPLNPNKGVSVNPVGRKLEFKGLDSIKFDASPCLRATDYKSPHCVWEGVEFKGKQIKDGDGLYLSASEDFFHGGLDGISRTLKANVNDAGVCIDYRIRKLTPRECFRLMGVNDTDIDKIQAVGISNSQQYKMAGNSIVVDVLYHLFRKMFIEKENESQQLTLF